MIYGMQKAESLMKMTVIIFQRECDVIKPLNNLFKLSMSTITIYSNAVQHIQFCVYFLGQNEWKIN